MYSYDCYQCILSLFNVNDTSFSLKGCVKVLVLYCVGILENNGSSSVFWGRYCAAGGAQSFSFIGSEAPNESDGSDSENGASSDSSSDSNADEQERGCYLDDDDDDDDEEEVLVAPEEDEDENEEDVRMAIAVTLAVAAAAAADAWWYAYLC